jgi:hypothetical protein
MKPTTNSSGVAKRGRPRNRDQHARRGEEALADLRQAGREHVVHPEPEADERGRDQRQHHRRVAEHGTRAERRHDRRHHAQRRDEDDVDLRVAEEPEQVLPEQRVAALRRVVEVRRDQAVERQEAARQHHRRHREHDHERRHEHRPHEQRHAVQRHAGCALLERGDDDLDRRDQRRELGEGHQLRPDVVALAGRVLRSGERHVAEPAGVRTDVGQERRPEQHAADQVRVVAVRVEAREGDVARAEHERHEVEPERLHHRYGEQEHHRRAVHGEDLIVEVGTEQLALGERELQPHHQRQHAGQREEDERRHDVAARDPLVVDGAEHADDARRRAPRVLELREVDLGFALALDDRIVRRRRGAHRRLPR